MLSQKSAQLQQSPETMADKDIHNVFLQIVQFTYRESGEKNVKFE